MSNNSPTATKPEGAFKYYAGAWYSEDGHSIANKVPGKCWHCGKPTVWIEINFEAPLCLGACTDAKWKEYQEVNNERLPKMPL